MVKNLQTEDHLTYLAEMFDILHKYKMNLNLNKCTFEVSFDKFLGFMVNWIRIKAILDKIRFVMKMEPPRMMKEV